MSSSNSLRLRTAPRATLDRPISPIPLKEKNENTTGPTESVDPGIQIQQAGPALLDYYLVSSLVLGGCCMNVWAYEELLKSTPGVGSALTFSQMLFISLQSIPRLLTWDSPSGVRWILPRIKPRQVPLQTWALQVLLLTSGSILNNWAFAYNVPVSVQIVFRSAGLGISMLFGRYFLGRSYTPTQIRSVILVSAGVVLATLSRPSTSRKDRSSDDVYKYILGVLMLVISLLFTGRLGLMQERTYKQYGPCWQEGVAYTHILSLPIFLFLTADIKLGFANLAHTANPTKAYGVMAINLLSQLMCVSAVNRLSSQVSSVSTNLVLTTRKAVSLCFSVWWFGNGFNLLLGAGAAMVFGGSVLFSLPSQVGSGKM